MSLACLRNGSLTKISPLLKEAVRRKQVYKFLESEILVMYQSKTADETKLKVRAGEVVLDESLGSTLRATNDSSMASSCCSNFSFFIFNFVSSGISCRDLDITKIWLSRDLQTCYLHSHSAAQLGLLSRIPKSAVLSPSFLAHIYAIISGLRGF